MSAEEEEPIIPKSRKVNDAIAPKRFNQVNLFKEKKIYFFKAKRGTKNRKANIRRNPRAASD